MTECPPSCGRCSRMFACVSSLWEVPRAPAVLSNKLFSMSSRLPTVHLWNRAATVTTYTHSRFADTSSEPPHTITTDCPPALKLSTTMCTIRPHTTRLPWLPNYLSVPTHQPVRNINNCSAEAGSQLFDSYETHTCSPATIMILTHTSLRP